MKNIRIIAAGAASRRWEHELLRRLSAAGHVVSVRHATVARPVDLRLEAVLALEALRFKGSLVGKVAPLPASTPQSFVPDVVIDLTGAAVPEDAPVLQLEFNGCTDLARGLGALLAGKTQAELRIRRNGVAVGQARPMIGDRVWLSRTADDVLAGAIALVEQTIARLESGELQPLGFNGTNPSAPGLLRHYLPSVATGLGARLAQKLVTGRKPFYWQVAYRLIDGPGVADTGALDGPDFTILPDDGARFYADPFPFEHQGRHFLFVEEFPYATGKGVIAVAELGANGRFERPRTVLAEPHHLSYPQVFEQDGEIYMLPESSAAHELVLYRATQFPDQWVRDTVLIADRNINDATLIEDRGQFWLVATERFDQGSASDKLVVFTAPALRGPWRPHRLNPIAIDHSAARPGGRFLRQGGRWVLPVQNGASTYGGGLGMMTLERLDADAVVFSAPRPIGPGPAWARAGIHTLNRVGNLEVVDSAG